MSPKATVAVVGAGAVGCYFGARLAQAGHGVTLIGRETHVSAIRSQGLKVETSRGVEVVAVDASTELAAAGGADWVLFCVKSTDTEAVARGLAPLLAPGAVVLSLQNGVDNAAVMARHLGQPVLAAVVYVATAMTGPGLVRHFGRGDLVIGAMGESGPRGGAAGTAPDAGSDARPDAKPDAPLAATLQAIAAGFIAAGVPVRISPDVRAELWSKLLVNCAYNAISGLAQANYAQIAALPVIHAVLEPLVREVVAVAAADGVRLPLDAALAATAQIAVAMPGQRSSTAQDMARRKPSEIDHLNGFVVRRGRELGVPTPINQTLHALVKLVEAGWSSGTG